MPLFSRTAVINLKLSSIPVDKLREFCGRLGLNNTGKGSEIIKRVAVIEDIEDGIDEFIREQYRAGITERRALISDNELKQELLKVESFSWGVVQGQLDRKIQVEYVRRFVRYDDLVGNARERLHDEVTSYVVCTWYNHWTTVLMEEHISQHPRIIPTLKKTKGIDIFFDGQPFDLKVTYLPRDYSVEEAIKNPKGLALWMYENQGGQRFGADNRLFVVLLDSTKPQDSWKLKRDFELVFDKIDGFFNEENVSESDELVFSYRRKTYTTVSKVLLVTK